MHKKMTDIMKTNFNFRIYQTTLKDTEQKFLVPSNCDLKIPLAYAELWRIMNSLEKKSVIKIARMQKHLLQALHKSVRIRSSSGPHFPVFGLNTERYGVTENLSVFSPNAGKCGPEF